MHRAGGIGRTGAVLSDNRAFRPFPFLEFPGLTGPAGRPLLPGRRQHHVRRHRRRHECRERRRGGNVRRSRSGHLSQLRLTPGSYPLSDLIYPSFSETGPNSDIPSSCWGGGGSFGEGTLEIVSVSSTDMVFRLHDTLVLDFNVNGSTFTAALCAGVTAAVPPVDSAP